MQIFGFFLCTFIKNKNLFYHMHKYHRIIYSVLWWDTAGSDYSLRFSWIWCYKLGPPALGVLFPFRYSQVVPGWMGRVAAQLFSGPPKDVQSGSYLGAGWATWGHSQIYWLTEATWSFSWLSVKVCSGLGGRPLLGRVLVVPNAYYL